MRNCNGCHKQLPKLQLQSPVIQRDLWEKVLKYFGLSENRPGPQLPAITPVYICTECMEEALGRRLTIEDIPPLPFNMYFKLYYFYNIPYDKVVEIRRHVELHIQNSEKYKSEHLQREVDFMSGVMLMITNSGYKQWQ